MKKIGNRFYHACPFCGADVDITIEDENVGYPERECACGAIVTGEVVLEADDVDEFVWIRAAKLGMKPSDFEVRTVPDIDRSIPEPGRQPPADFGDDDLWQEDLPVWLIAVRVKADADRN